MICGLFLASMIIYLQGSIKYSKFPIRVQYSRIRTVIGFYVIQELSHAAPPR